MSKKTRSKKQKRRKPGRPAKPPSAKGATARRPGVGATKAGSQRSSAAKERALNTWYNAARAPEAAMWLARDEAERVAEVESYHQALLADNQCPPNLKLHATLHVLVENQLAMNDPVEAAAAIDRLVADGLSRHDAVHAVGWLVSDYMNEAVKKQQPIDREGYVNELKTFDAERWMMLAGAG